MCCEHNGEETLLSLIQLLRDKKMKNVIKLACHTLLSLVLFVYSRQHLEEQNNIM
jgi:hypothetical protein